MILDPSAADVRYGDDPVALIVADDDGAAGVAKQAVELAGGRLAGRIGFAEAATRLRDQALLSILLLELDGVDERLAEDVLARADAIGRERGVGVVVALAEPQIDWVSAQLLGGPSQLLCAPTLGDRVAALVLAGATEPSYHNVHSDEAARLRQLHSEVARIAETLARLTRPEEREPAMRASVRDRPLGFGMPPIESAGPIEPRDVRGAIRARRMRDNHFAAELFADPAWDMLLDLFAAELEHARVSVSSLCIAAAVPGTTALRWIGTMIDAGLFERQADPFDRRRAYVALSERAGTAMRRYFEAVHRAGLHSA